MNSVAVELSSIKNFLCVSHKITDFTHGIQNQTQSRREPFITLCRVAPGLPPTLCLDLQALAKPSPL